MVLLFLLLPPSRTKLAVVDETLTCSIYDLHTKQLLFTEPNANSVAWNTEYEDMFCFSGNGQLSIKTDDFPLHQQKLQGFVVGFKGFVLLYSLFPFCFLFLAALSLSLTTACSTITSFPFSNSSCSMPIFFSSVSGSKVFCLHYVAMHTIDVPQSPSLYRYLERKDFIKAHKIACLGVPNSDWRALAMESLAAMDFITARKAFIRIRDLRFIDLINRFESQKAQGFVCADSSCRSFSVAHSAHDSKFDENLALAEIYAYQGKFEDAARVFRKGGHGESMVVHVLFSFSAVC